MMGYALLPRNKVSPSGGPIQQSQTSPTLFPNLSPTCTLTASQQHLGDGKALPGI